jgi:aminomethyltransferase
VARLTPLHSRTGALCKGSRWEEWSGFLAARMYALDHLHEYNAIRSGCALFDVSPLLKYDIRGRDAHALMDRVVVRDVSSCRIGQVLYTTWCDDDGKVIDDGTLSRLSEDHFRMTSAVRALHWLQDNAVGLDVEIEDVSEQYAAVSLQGPTSRDLLRRLGATELEGLRFFRCTQGHVAGVSALISRTGYTGDLGYELFVRPDDAEKIWDSITELGDDYQMCQAGTVALDLARIEAGLLLLDADFVSAAQTMFDVQKTSPYDLGLHWMVDLDKEFFVGQSALRREKEVGSRWNTVGLELDVTALEKFYAKYDMPLHLPHQAWSDAVPVYADEAQTQHIGRGTSGMWSSTLKKYIVMARLKPEYAKLGKRIFIEEMIEAVSHSVPATVVKMPFFDPPRKKQT